VNNREKATLIWMGIALAAALMSREIRGSLWDVVKAFLAPMVIGPVLALAAWTAGLCALAHTVGLWKTDVRNDSVLWFVTVGLAFFFSLENITEGGFFRKTARRAVALTAFVEAFANLEVFGLAVELVCLPIIVLLGLMLVVSEGKDEYAPTRSFLNGLLTIIGLCVLAYVLVRLATHFDAGHTVRAFALPVWLTIGSMPFIYAFALLAEYEQAFLQIDFRTDDPSRRRRAKRALLRGANVRVAELGGFAGHWIRDLTSADSDDAAHVLIRRWRATWREERHSERAHDAREYMKDWLTATEPALREVYADMLRSRWEHLDGDQRATLKAEGLRRAPRRLADDVRALPE
jgi:hypothetical protein